MFTGAIASGEDISALDSQKRLDLEMRGEAGGSQTLNITNAGFDGNVTVYSGTLLMGNTSSRRSNSGSDLFNQLVIEGGEFGATTGRPRRCGWCDLVAVDYAVKVNGLDGIAKNPNAPNLAGESTTYIRKQLGARAYKLDEYIRQLLIACSIPLEEEFLDRDASPTDALAASCRAANASVSPSQEHS